MKKNDKYILLLAFLAILVFIVPSCKKENISEEPEETSSGDWLDGRQVKYNVLVVSEDNDAKGFYGASVALSINGSIEQAETDSTGQATFYNVVPGVAAVTVSKEHYTTVNYTVNLYQNLNDSVYDVNNMRNASTMVMIFPLSSSYHAVLKGRLFADLDLTSAGNEAIAQDLNVYAQIEPTQLLNFITHEGDGEMMSVVYENTRFTGQYTSATGYSISVPAAYSGLEYEIIADDFEYNQQIDATTVQRKIYNLPLQHKTLYSGKTTYMDLIFN